MKELITKHPAMIANVLLDAAIEKARQRTIQKKIDYITEVTTSKLDSVHSQTHNLIKKKIANVWAITNSIYDTIEQNIDTLSPAEVLYFMDLIHKAQSGWRITEEEAEAIIEDLNKTSFPLD